MAITASMVKDLRERTGVAMMKCKKALDEAGGDIEAAVELLRKQGAATADKKADRATNCGGLGIAYAGGKGAAVLVQCETDFVSGNDLFKTFVNDIAQAALDNSIESIEALESASIAGSSVKDALIEKIQQLGENMQLSTVQLIEGETVTGYNHGGRVAALVAGSGEADVLRNVAMHVAASQPAPESLDRDGVNPELVEKERAIIAESDEVKSKPEQIRPKIVDGKMNRFFKESVLLEQEMLVANEDGSNVQKWATANKVGVSGFIRLSI